MHLQAQRLQFTEGNNAKWSSFLTSITPSETEMVPAWERRSGIQVFSDKRAGLGPDCSVHSGVFWQSIAPFETCWERSRLKLDRVTELYDYHTWNSQNTYPCFWNIPTDHQLQDCRIFTCRTRGAHHSSGPGVWVKSNHTVGKRSFSLFKEFVDMKISKIQM